jgi:hypothetical protein
MKIPLGHSIASHVVLGFCCKDPGREVWEELAAWQLWAGEHLPEVRAMVDKNGTRELHQ